MTTLTLYRLAFLVLVAVLVGAVIRHSLHTIFAQRRKPGVRESATQEDAEPLDRAREQQTASLYAQVEDVLQDIEAWLEQEECN